MDAFDETTVRNDGLAPLTLAIEPHGDVFWLDPGDSARVVATGPSGGSLEVVRTEHRIEVYFWVGATGRVLDGETDELVQDFPIGFPDSVPSGMTIVEFVHLMNNHTAWHKAPADRRISRTRQRSN